MRSYTRLLITVGTLSLLVLTTLLARSEAANVQPSDKVLWSFSLGTFDGTYPNGPLVMDASGNLYGTTSLGGDNGGSADYAGTAFKLTPAGQESVLWNFGSSDSGNTPLGGLIIDKIGNLYGTTTEGGIYDDFFSDFGGTIFKLTSSGQESILWSFGNGADGQNPVSSLLMDPNGNLFGTTLFGGTFLGGTAFELTSSGQESVLWDFGSGADGAGPLFGLTMDAGGNLYGTTPIGGAHGGGTLFKLTPVTTPAGAASSTTTSYTESILWSFGSGTDANRPTSSPILDASGNLFGVAALGGTNGVGAVYEVTADGQESILWNFGNGADGQYPGGLIMDSNGNLYGVTNKGGANSGCGFPTPTTCGTVYKLTPPSVAGGAWSETILWNFGPSPDAYFPYDNLLMDASGNLYGAAGGGASDGGSVFEITNVSPSGQISLSAQHIQFANTAVGGSASYQLAIRNTGTGQLTGAIATPPAPFGLQGSGSFNLAPKTQTKITLTFDPTAPTRVHRLATITSNSAKQGSINLDLRGIGVAPAASKLASR